MRTSSAYALRGTGRGGASTKPLPAEGSKIRFVYDLLYEYRGRAVPDEDWKALKTLVGTGDSVRDATNLRSILYALRDYYGCDLCRMPGHKRMTLVGEWSGKVYIDYTAPALEQFRAPRAPHLRPRHAD